MVDARNEAIVRAAVAWRRHDFETEQREAGVLRGTPVSAVVRDFCDRSDALCDRVGADAVGEAVCYYLGSATQVWLTFQKRHESTAAQVEAVLSLKSLYRTFAKRLAGPSEGTTRVASRLGTACYMLWDMDAGLESIPMAKSPSHLIEPCWAVLSDALSLGTPACHLSALHGLGHLREADRGRVESLIDEYLSREQAKPSAFLREYAQRAREGGVQ